MERIVKGIWIPIEIWQDSSLSWNEKILLMEIDSFTAKGKDCYVSNEYIATMFGVSERTARTYISNLCERGFVKITKFDGRMRYVESCLNNFHAEWKKTSGLDGDEFPHTINKNTNINNTLSINKASRFKKPTLQEIHDYCAERNNNVDAETFFDFYEAKGWLVGKSPMKDWKAAVRTWEKRPDEKKASSSPYSPSSPYRKGESIYEHNRRVLKNLTGR